MTTRLADLVQGAMASTFIKHDEHGHPVYASDVRLGNRKTRRNLLREQRRLMAETRT